MRILSIVGNRPQFVKAAAVSRKLRREHEELLVHTGQHYDDGLSAIFFRELDLPRPDRELEAGSGTQAGQTATILESLEPVALEVQPDLAVIYGDTNSTLAGALVAAKCLIPLVHVEAGMRSFDRTMPEEINRVVADRCSDLLLCASETAIANLKAEGMTEHVYLTGDVMLDVAVMTGPISDRRSRILDELELEAGGYVVVTAHRAGNVDDPERLRALVELIAAIPERVVFPVHPRTRERLEETGLLPRLEKVPAACVLPPVGYLDFLKLLRNAKAVLTDSGGAQKEAYLFSVPCLTLRDRTEWVETVDTGWNRLVDIDVDATLAALDMPLPPDHPELYGNGQAADRLVDVVSAWGADLGLSKSN